MLWSLRCEELSPVTAQLSARINGGLKNPVTLPLSPLDYDYWHWGPDEALDVHSNGLTRAGEPMLKHHVDSFQDIESWLADWTMEGPVAAPGVSALAPGLPVLQLDARGFLRSVGQAGGSHRR